MNPPSRTQRTTRSRSPTAALSWARTLIAQRRAASWPSSMETSDPTSLVHVGQLPIEAETELARDDDEVAGADERNVVGDRRCGTRQRDADLLKVGLDGAHACLPSDVAPALLADRPR